MTTRISGCECKHVVRVPLLSCLLSHGMWILVDEITMLQCFLGSHAFLGVILEQTSEEIITSRRSRANLIPMGERRRSSGETGSNSVAGYFLRGSKNEPFLSGKLWVFGHVYYIGPSFLCKCAKLYCPLAHYTIKDRVFERLTIRST